MKKLALLISLVFVLSFSMTCVFATENNDQNAISGEDIQNNELENVEEPSSTETVPNQDESTDIPTDEPDSASGDVADLEQNVSGEDISGEDISGEVVTDTENSNNEASSSSNGSAIVGAIIAIAIVIAVVVIAAILHKD